MALFLSDKWVNANELGSKINRIETYVLSQNETVEIGNDSFIEDVAHPGAASAGQPAPQPENLDAENENENDQDLSVEAEPPMEQAVSLN
jgi:hypothetical protein